MLVRSRLRQRLIAGFRKRSEVLQAKADDVLARYQASIRAVRVESEQSRREQLDAARSERSTITAEARGGAERQLEAARGELEASLVQARATLRENAQGLARDAAETVLGRSLS